MTRNAHPTRRTLLSGLAGGAGLLATGCAAEPSEGTLIEVEPSSTAPSEPAEGLPYGPFRIAFVDGDSPYSFVDEDSGEPTGIGPELTRELLRRIGYSDRKLEFVAVAWDQLLVGLGTQHDLAAAAMAVTSERCDRAAFFGPSVMMGSSFLVPAGNPEGIVDLASVAADPDLKLGGYPGTVEWEVAENAGLGEQLVALGSSLVEDLLAGNVDAVVSTAPTVNYLAAQTAELEAGPLLAEVTPLPLGTACRVEFSALAEAAQSELDALRADPDQLLSLLGDFGVTAAELPEASYTLEAHCRA